MGCQRVRCDVDLEVANIPRSGKDAASQLQKLAAGAEKNRNELLPSPPCGSKMPKRARKAIVLATIDSREQGWATPDFTPC